MKHTLLIVEDDLDTSEMLRVYFEAQGYRVVTAGSGREALEKCRAESPNLILLDVRLPDFYYMSVQEDEYIEWASFWAFLLAAVAAIIGGGKYRGESGRFPWFLYGIALFCFVVAMEEISWGQRLLGYRPPVYFLEHNFQQEFNFHNVIATDFRKLALSITIAGYGVALPFMALIPPLGISRTSA